MNDDLQEEQTRLIELDTQWSKFKAILFTWLFCPVIVFVVLYLMGSFTAGDTNATHWTDVSRYWFAAIWFFGSAIVIGISFALLDSWTGYPEKLDQVWQENWELRRKNKQLLESVAALNKKINRIEKGKRAYLEGGS